MDLHAVLKGFAAGGVAAAVSKTTVAPMDRVKLVLQLQTGQSIAIGSEQRQYKGIVDCFQKLCAEQGVKSLWRGNMAGVIRCFPSQALNICLRDAYRLILLTGIDSRRQTAKFALGNMMAGGAAGATTLFMLYPLDFVRTRLAVDTALRSEKQFAGMLDCFRQIAAKEGMNGLYRGFIVSLQFVIASRAVFFGIFDTAKAEITEHNRYQLHFLSLWCLAQASIITSSLLCYPLDTIRRQMMMQSGEEVKMYKNSVECLQKLIQREGVQALYRGVVSNSLRCTSGALVLAVYYEILKYM